jgi:hypothetical protein
MDSGYTLSDVAIIVACLSGAHGMKKMGDHFNLRYVTVLLD